MPPHPARRRPSHFRDPQPRPRLAAALDPRAHPLHAPHPDGGEFRTWVEVTEVSGSPTSFLETHVGHTELPDGTTFAHAETLRFRSEDEIRESLEKAGFAVEQVWGDWDRSPVTTDSDELIVLARPRSPGNNAR